MGAKATFNPITKIITLTQAPVGGFSRVDAGIDLYSDAKEDWLADPSLRKFALPFRAVGGNDLGGGLLAGTYYFLRNDLGWRIIPYDADHELTIVGNLYPQDPLLPMFVYQPARTVTVSLERSSLTQRIASDSESVSKAVWDKALASATPAGSALEALKRIDQTSGDNQALILAK